MQENRKKRQDRGDSERSCRTRRRRAVLNHRSLMSLGGRNAAAVKRALLAEAGVRLLESSAVCARLADSLLLQEGPPTVLAISCRRAGPPRHPIVLLALAVGRSGEPAAAADTAPTFLLDLARSPDVLAEGGLQRLLQSAEVDKVFHYGALDAGELSDRFGFGWRQVCDVGLAFEALVAEGGQPRRRVSLHRLLTLATTAAGGDRDSGGGPSPHLREEEEAGHAYWQRRPLTVAMALEAAAGARAILGAHAAGLGGALWGPLVDLGAYRRAAASADPGGDWRAWRSGAQAAHGAELRLRWAEARGGATAVVSDAQPLARKLPFGILK